MPTWRPDQYLIFEKERTRPCHDLVAQLAIDAPARVIDLGCGPGNSTAVLCQRWPSANVTGLDSSIDMLKRAHLSNPRLDLLHIDITEWMAEADGLYDVVFSNAALQGVPDHASSFPKLLGRVAEGGALAAQMPANWNAPAHEIMRDLAVSSRWRRCFPSSGVREWFVHGPDFYYDVLCRTAQSQNIWETTYLHVLPDIESIAEWYRGTGLRPFLDLLHNDDAREEFVADYVSALRGAYSTQQDGCILFPFKRLFLVALK